MHPALPLLISLAFVGSSGGQSPLDPPVSLGSLNRNAQASDLHGIRSYSDQLVRMVVPKKAGPKLINSLSDGLASAEVEARAGKRKLISETEVAQAFNELMAKIGAPASLRADAADVKRIRIAMERPMPTLISCNRNNEDCYPGEAFFLVGLLFENVGLEAISPPDTKEPTLQSRYWGHAQSQTLANLHRFVSENSKRTVGDAFKQLVSALDF